MQPNYVLRNERDARDLGRVLGRERQYGGVEMTPPMVQDAGGGGSAGVSYQNFHRPAMYINATQGDPIIVPRGSTASGLILATVARDTVYFPNSAFSGGVQVRYFLPSESQFGISRPVTDPATGGYVYMSTFGHSTNIPASGYDATAFVAFRFRNTAENTSLYNPLDESVSVGPVLTYSNGEPVVGFGGASIIHSTTILFG